MSWPICVAPSKNVTDETVPSLSAAFAETVIVVPATTDAPFIGAVMLTVGGTFGGPYASPKPYGNSTVAGGLAVLL